MQLESSKEDEITQSKIWIAKNLSDGKYITDNNTSPMNPKQDKWKEIHILA